ncbi:DEAD/DEAH box helicase domain-containing protein [Besnoitia besnoiti]|uniref:ATP-dependent RNA helicase n=1 Tax=Besnoitia besnoiti TaxID=94643 RepID=A0A2A9MGE2_BESBE|nr:DEAD/DEAH box helicase domain-containing protein [Besnoitia besnoiti]PFH34452.1 DEAD/DEAH box helicase domain-containing protein [Besnoitia besnoiti]
MAPASAGLRLANSLRLGVDSSPRLPLSSALPTTVSRRGRAGQPARSRSSDAVRPQRTDAAPQRRAFVSLSFVSGRRLPLPCGSVSPVARREACLSVDFFSAQPRPTQSPAPALGSSAHPAPSVLRMGRATAASCDAETCGASHGVSASMALSRFCRSGAPERLSRSALRGDRPAAHHAPSLSPSAAFFSSAPSSRLEGGAGTDEAAAAEALTFEDLLRTGRLSEGSYRALESLLSYRTLTKEQALLLPQLLPSRAAGAVDADAQASGRHYARAALCGKAPFTSQGQARDCLIQARTGTGKTLCFLLAVIERLLLQPPAGVGGLIIAPTRELAAQILREAEQLSTFHPFEVAALVGGNPRKADELLLKRKRPQLVVCTPGRLLDHLEGTFMFSALFEQLQVLVLDEADRLMELGHLEELKQVFSYLPRNRQSLLFSATLTDKVKEIASRMFKPDYRFFDCVAPDEKPTHARVEQSVVVHPAKKTATVLFNILREEFERHPHTYKIMVFFPTARLTSFFATLFREQFRIGVYEIHRRRESSARAATASRFSRDRAGVLFSSDVSARGVDYPDVSLVIQVCAPLTRELYIHRVGRTGRIGKGGRAVLLLNEAEKSFLGLVHDLPIQRREELALQQRTPAVTAGLESWETNAQLHYAATAAYASLLNHYKSGGARLSITDDGIIQTALDVCASCGLSEQPAISKKLATLLNLEGHPKLKVQENLDNINYLPEFAD